MIINNSSIFMSMLNLIIIIIIMDMKNHINMCLFMSMLVGKERG